MPRPRTYIDEAGNVCNGQDAQDAYDRNEESKSEEERENEMSDKEIQESINDLP